MTPSSAVLDFLRQWSIHLGAQFRGLDRNDPSAWPAAPRRALYLGVAMAVFALLWVAWLGRVSALRDAVRAQEQTLRAGYVQKARRVSDWGPLQQQRTQAEQYVRALEKQLPGKSEIDALLSDINQAGRTRGLQFELFRPGPVVIEDYGAEIPIALRVTGGYHDMGAFVADIAHLPRIVTLNNLVIAPGKDSGTLTLEATAKTFRALDPDEQKARKQAKAAAAAQGKKR
ncbi:MAG: type 4a pilus biogenesis protein PilO [Burkholderiaceae bacterium]|nr:type 4a pilus biogenesis protein PilO [Burkholderiaceae bacterium]